MSFVAEPTDLTATDCLLQDSVRTLELLGSTLAQILVMVTEIDVILSSLSGKLAEKYVEVGQGLFFINFCQLTQIILQFEFS